MGTEREREKKKNREKVREREKEERRRGKGKEVKRRHGPKTLVLLREPLSRSQSVACPCRLFKALAGSSTHKKLFRR